MTGDFVTEATQAVARLHRKRRNRQLMYGGGLMLFALLLLISCGGGGLGSLAFVFLVAGIGLALYLEWLGMRLESAVDTASEKVPKVHFVSSKDGLFFQTDTQFFVESREQFFDGKWFGGPVSVSYLGELHAFRFQKRTANAGRTMTIDGPLDPRTVDVAVPRDMKPDAAVKLAQRLDGWGSKLAA